MHKNPSETNIKDTEQLILEAAEEEFLEKGFVAARTTTIAASAGVTHAMLHYYFRTKEKLFERIISEKIKSLKDAIIGSVTDFDAPLNVIIRNIIDRHLDFVAANPLLPRFLIVEIFNNAERAALFLDRLKEYAPIFVSFLQTKIDKEAEAGKCKKTDATTLMLDLISLNIFPYVATPAINAALGNCMADPEEFLALRKKENYDTIMSKLKI